MKYLAFLLMLGAGAAYAEIREIPPYVKLQEALAGDNFTAAVEAHKEVCEKAKKFIPEYKGCEHTFKNIEDVRTSFRSLSDLYIAKVSKDNMKGLAKMYCPHAKAHWIQKDGPLRNPYYGKSMLECGMKI